MTRSWFKGKRITVFGIGLLGGGVGVIRFLAENGAYVIATDIKSEKDLAQSLKKLENVKNITYILGRHRREDFSNVDMVVKTPACPWTNEHVILAQEHKIPVETDASLFFQLCTNTIIGITGTKGKTTTAHIIDHILRTAGKHPLRVGIGTTSVLDRLDQIKKNTIVVFELSSWRLSALKYTKKSPHVAVFTNIFPDHLNYYKTMEAYLQDKKQIFLHQKVKDYFIYNADDPLLKEIDCETRGQVIKASSNRITDGESVFAESGALFVNDGIDTTNLIDVEDVSLRGQHNTINILLAIAATRAVGVTNKYLVTALKTFVPIKHRLEHVLTRDDVSYYNDSAATNPGSTIAALASFSKPIILLAGGADKKLPVGELAGAILDSTKSVIFFEGIATDRIIREIHALQKESGHTLQDFVRVSSMQEALDEARRQADHGDVVLLSPGAASFGLFKNEFDRGDQFRDVVLG